jgi:hypothetical protein
MVRKQKILINKNHAIIGTCVLIIFMICYIQYNNQLHLNNKVKSNFSIENNKIQGILKKDLECDTNKCGSSGKHVRFDIQSHSPYDINHPVQYPIKNPNMYSYGTGNPRYNDDHDRIFNPLRFPYKKPLYFSTDCNETNAGPGHMNNNYSLGHPEFDSIGRCGVNNIPTNVRTQKWCSTPFQVGILTRDNTTDNTEIYPLFGRRKYRQDNKWEYYTIINGVKVYVKPKSNFDEIFNNESVILVNFNGNYKVTIYDKEMEYDY